MARARQVGMAANPITFQEIQAFAWTTRTYITAWEVRLIRRVDDAVLAVFAANAPKPKGQDQASTDIPVSRVGAIRDLFRGLAARKAKKQTPAEEGPG